MRAVAVLLALGTVVSCARGDDIPGDILIVTDPAWEPALTELVALTPYGGLTVTTTARAEDDYTITVTTDATVPAEGFQVSEDGRVYTVRASDVLGAQYGVSAALESLGFRFRHPYATYVPQALAQTPIDTAMQQPDIRIRGFQLHTLHPIEPYFAMWEESPTSLLEAKQIIDWTIKNRGNYVQWVGLDDIYTEPSRTEPWLEHTKQILEYGRARGVKFGFNLQLFGASNLQRAYDLVDEEDPTVRPFAEQIAERLPLITTQGVTFDIYHLSFGEFFSLGSDAFIAAINEVESQLRALAPNAEMHGLIHVGDTAKQRVDYMGENIIYYFLVKFANANIVPDVHTVQLYNLFEDAGGTYHHERFDEHLAFLRERMCAGKKVSYLPETAYWVAFDNSVPLYLPLYVRSRWLDLHNLQAPSGPCGVLDQHILFSTGWEWGYWLNDVASLRASYHTPATPGALIAEQFAPDLGPGPASIIDRLMTEQRDALIHDRLMPYLAGTDTVNEAGYRRPDPIIAAPDRYDTDELTPDMADMIESTVVTPLADHVAALTQLTTQLHSFTFPDSRWSRELLDGFDINLLRARFVHDQYRSVVAFLRGDTATAEDAYAAAYALVADGEAIVARRHADMHDRHGRRLVDATTNHTIYQYGYLFYADNLCYWKRELVKLRNVMDEVSYIEPACFFGRPPLEFDADGIAPRT